MLSLDLAAVHPHRFYYLPLSDGMVVEKKNNSHYCAGGAILRYTFQKKALTKTYCT
jgi:hypothetical protein